MQLAGYKINFAKEAIALRSEGKTYQSYANDKDIPYSSLIKWIRFVEANSPGQDKEKDK